MKKIIILSLSFCAVIFLIGGIYIITNVQEATSKQNYLIMLHQIEILREHLLIHMGKTQADLDLRNTPYARDTDTIVSNVLNLNKILTECFNCHHRPNVEKRLSELKSEIGLYKSHVSRILTLRDDNSRVEAEEEKAFHLADDIMDQVNTMVHFTTGKLEKRTQSILEDIKATKITVYALIILTPFFVAFISYLFTRQLTQPIKTLLEATRKLKGGDLDHRISGLKDEFGEVATSFNDMAASLKDQMQNMQRAEQMVLIGELAAGLAHEIKNPLSGIKVTLKLLSEETSISENDKDIAVQAIQKIKLIELLLKSLLDFAKPPKPQFSLTDINKVLEKIVQFAKKYPSFSSGEKRPIKIDMDFNPDLPQLLVDPMQMEQSFLNLILNAFDAMADGGTLDLRTAFENKDNTIIIEVRDTGKGIENNRINDIFKPFFTTKVKGTGLGLAVTRRFIEQNRGKIYVESTPGKGTTFRIFLPVRSSEKLENNNN